MNQNILPVAHQFFAQVAATPSQHAFHYCDPTNGQWVDMTWRTYGDNVAKVAAWLQAQGIGKGDRVAILSGNCPEWIMTDIAIQAVGGICVPIYATSSAKDVSYICQHADIKLVFADTAKRTEVLTDCPVATVVLYQDAGPNALTLRTNTHTWAQILQSTTTPIPRAVDVRDDDIATLIYTSGTTGNPKGVIHTVGTVKACVAPVLDVFREGKPAAPADRLFSFLPLSHVAERVLIALLSVYTGTEVAFARGIDTLSEDLVRCRPTVLLCVPRLWEKIFEKIQSGLRTASPGKRAIFGLAKNLGSIRISGNRVYRDRDQWISAKISDGLVGKKLRARLGLDRTRMLLTGSAPTRPDVMRFFASFGLMIREVYGLTENLCLGVLNDHSSVVIGSCGKLFHGGEMQIAADGEICFRAPWNFKGYYKNEEATRDSINKDGWFMTGDLGQVDDQGYLRIVGRKKELLKTSGGKYVAPVPIEDLLKANPIIADAMVVGDNRKYCVALISLDPEHVNSQPELDVTKELGKFLEEVNAQLASYESIKRLGIMRAAFSVEAGTLTPTLKLKRKVACEQKQQFIEKVYDANQQIIVES